MLWSMSDVRASSRVSVVVSFCDEPEHLCMVLIALRRQTVLPAEVLIADDGSSAENVKIVADFAKACPFPVVHVRQPHEGFRLARNRNNAIYRAKNEFIASLDQDTLPHRRWLERFLEGLRPGRVCTGYVLRLSEENSARLNHGAVERNEFEAWHAESEHAKLDKLQRKFLFYVVLRRLGLGVKGRPAIAFGNAAVCRSDLLRVNGFDEEYVGWGQEDDDLGWRLYRSGVRPVALVNRALVSHIHHPPRHGDWRNGANIERYRRPRASFRCERGLDKHPHPDVFVTVLNEKDEHRTLNLA